MALTSRARRSNCSGRTSLREASCGSSIRRDLLNGGFCQGIESDRSSGKSDASSASSDLSRTISLSLCTTIPATSCTRAPRSSMRAGLVVDLSCWVARCSFRNFTTESSMSAAGTRQTDPAKVALPLHAGRASTRNNDSGRRLWWHELEPSDGRRRRTAVPSAGGRICCV